MVGITTKLSSLLLLLGYTYSSLLASEIGCNALKDQESGCTQESILAQEISSQLEKIDVPKEPKRAKNPQKINITQKLKSVEILYQNKPFLIERESHKEQKSCPPHCIQPMYIKNIKTIGELETLTFIQKAQKNKQMLVIDSRGTKKYRSATIPSAINIPSSLLNKKSKYSQKILKLLGGKKLQGKWYFKYSHKLLIFDNGIWDDHASKLIDQLITVGYPQKQIVYYRGGVHSWREAGLTLF
jgi:rhodanese-related sulfurtransferase